MAYEKQNFVEDQILKATHLNNMEDGIVANAESIDEIETTMDTIDENVDDIESLVNTINTNVDSVKTDVASVKTDVGTVNTNVSNVKTTIDTINTNLTTVDSIVDTINSNVSSVKTTVGTINTNASTAATKATAAATDAASIKTTVNTINSNVNSIKSSLTNNNGANIKYNFSDSNTVIKTLISSEISYKGINGPLVTPFIHISGQGTIRITASLKSSATSTSAKIAYTLRRKVSTNDGPGYYEYKTNGDEPVTSAQTSYTTVYGTLNVCDGDFIAFALEASKTTTTAYCKLLTICADKSIAEIL